MNLKQAVGNHLVGALALATLLACGAPAWAASPALGEPAPELGPLTWVMNAPKEDSLQKLRGEVVLVERWGVKCGPCVALIPHIEKLQQTYGERGLHIFAIESQNHSADEIRAKVGERGGKTYPVAAGGGASFRGDGTIPVAWLIGVDGKVIWQGNPAAETSKLDALIEAEVAKVRFPGLGKTEFDDAVLKAVKAYLSKDYGKARSEASAVAAKDSSSPKAKEDAEYIVAKVDELSATQIALAEKNQAEGNFLEAYETLDWLAKSFKKTEAGDKAAALLKAFKSDKQLKRELKAALALQSLCAKLQGQPEDVRAAALAKFAASKIAEGTAAAQRATSLK